MDQQRMAVVGRCSLVVLICTLFHIHVAVAVCSGPNCWQQVAPLPPEDLFGIGAASGNDIWAVGTKPGNEPLALHYNGSEWVATPTSITNHNFRGVGVFDNRALAAGGGITAYWNGASWSEIPYPLNTAFFSDVLALSATDFWSVGWDQGPRGVAAHRIDNSWTIEFPNVGASVSTLWDAVAPSSNDVWAVGSYRPFGIADDRPLAVRRTNGVWSLEPTPLPPGANVGGFYRITSIPTAQGYEIWAVGRAGFQDHAHPSPPVLQPFAVRRSASGQWSLVPTLPAGPSGGLFEGVAALSSNDVWLGGQKSVNGQTFGVFQHCNGLESCTCEHVPGITDSRSGITDMLATQPNTFWAVGNYTDAQNVQQSLILKYVKDPSCQTHADCNDGVACNGVEQCVAGSCLSGTSPCNDNVACTDDCDRCNDVCSPTPNSAKCSNSNACDGDEICNPVTGCQPGPPPNCDDGKFCTVDSCNSVSGCVYTPRCSPSQYCDEDNDRCLDPCPTASSCGSCRADNSHCTISNTGMLACVMLDNTIKECEPKTVHIKRCPCMAPPGFPVPVCPAENQSYYCGP